MDYKTLPQLVGGNLRTIRTDAGLTLEAFAKGMRWHGVRWNTSRAGEFERGELPVSLSLLLVVAQVIKDLTGRAIRLADLLAGDEIVELNRGFAVTGASLAEAFTGAPVKLDDDVLAYTPEEVAWLDTGKLVAALEQMPQDVRISEAIEVSQHEGVAEARVAKALGVPHGLLTAWSTKLWGRSLSQERDARSRPGDSAQRRGRITRDLIAELRSEMEQQNG